MFKSSIVVRFALVVVVTSLFTASRWSQEQPAGAKSQATPPDAKTVPKVYDEGADAKKQIAEALAKAGKEHRRVLIQWGGNWCGWCIKLHGLYKSNKDISRKLMYEYDVVYVDAGKNDKNMDLAKSYDATCAKEGFPYLTVLDADGKVIANHETGSFENKDQEAKPGHDPAKVLVFLTEYQATPLDAQKVLDDGLAKAKAENKRVFLHFGAPWCGWCHKLEDWMAREDVNLLLAKDFIDVKIDEDRMTGGKSLKPKYGADDKAGIPWFAFLDADGTVIITSMGPKGNTGFPQAPLEIAHFETMLKKGAKNLNHEDLKALCASLTTKEVKAAAK